MRLLASCRGAWPIVAVALLAWTTISMHVQAASQMPGVPLPIDSAVAYKPTLTTLLPRGQLVFSKGDQMYTYDPIMQRTKIIEKVMDFFSPPNAAGINRGGTAVCNAGVVEYEDATVIIPSDTATWWRDTLYYFSGLVYWRFKTDSASSLTTISSGWRSMPNHIDAWLTSSLRWSYVFSGSTVYRYNNQADTGDVGNGYPAPIATAWPGMPNHVSDVDFEPNRGMWVAFKGQDMTLYDPVYKKVYPGYPRPVHQDDQDGGTDGVGRTMCSGTTELATSVGFIEDKSPENRAMDYAPNRECQWTVQPPSNLLKQGGSGVVWDGSDVQITRFDLGDAAQLYILDNNDMPADMSVYSTNNEFAMSMSDIETDRRARANYGFAIPAVPPVPTVIYQFNHTNPPPANFKFVAGRSSLSFTVKLVTGEDDVVQGTGFALEWAVRPPISNPLAPYDVHTYRTLFGLFHFGSLHAESEQSAMIAPPVLAPEFQTMNINLMFQMYPNDDAGMWDDTTLVATNSSGHVIKTCDGPSMYTWTKTHIPPTCAFTATGPVRLEWKSLTAVPAATVIGEWITTSICNTPEDQPHLHTALNGTIVDGSGDKNYYASNSRCHWLLQASDPDVIFITLHTDMIDTQAGADRIQVLDGPSFTTSPLIAEISGYTRLAAPLKSSTPAMALRFISDSTTNLGGFQLSYRMVFPALSSSVSIHGFAPISSVSPEALKAVGSVATGVMFAGVTEQALEVTGLDKYGRRASFEFEDWFNFILRWIPITLVGGDSALLQALQRYPRPLTATNSTFWQSRGYTISDAQLDSIFEYPFQHAQLAFRAPTKGGVDYNVTLVFVMDAHSAIVHDMERSDEDSSLYTSVPFQQIIRVTAYKASSAHSSFVAAAPSSVVAGRSAASTSPPLLPRSLLSNPPLPAGCSLGGSSGMECNGDGVGANGNFEVGQTIEFSLVTRDAFDNQMEDFGVADDVRAFLSSIASSPPAQLRRVTGGLYSLSIAPTVAADDYRLTVLVSGSDVFEGPFRPRMLPAATHPAACTIICEWTGLSLITYALPLGENVPIVVTLRDRFGNRQLPHVAALDNVRFEWPGHNFVLQNRNGSDLTYTVTLSRFEVSSRLRVAVNTQPLGYDPDNLAAAGLADGIVVAIGVPVVTPYDQPASVYIGFVTIAGLLIAGTLVLLVYIHQRRMLAPIRVAAPTFLQLMLVGACMCYSTIIPMAQPEVSDVSCALEPLLGHFGFLMLFGALFVKTWRVRTIFQAKKLQVQVISDGDLLLRLGAMLGLYLVYYIVWMVVARPQPSPLQRGYTMFLECKSSEPVFPTMILIVEGVFVLYGAYLSATIWSLPSQFNESKFILVATYNVAVIGGLLLLLVKAILDEPDVQLLFAGVGLLVVTTLVVISMFLPRLLLLWWSSPYHNNQTANGTYGTVTLPSVLEGNEDSASPHLDEGVRANITPNGPHTGGTTDSKGATHSVRVHMPPGEGGNMDKPQASPRVLGLKASPTVQAVGNGSPSLVHVAQGGSARALRPIKVGIEPPSRRGQSGVGAGGSRFGAGGNGGDSPLVDLTPSPATPVLGIHGDGEDGGASAAPDDADTIRPVPSANRSQQQQEGGADGDAPAPQLYAHDDDAQQNSVVLPNSIQQQDE